MSRCEADFSFVLLRVARVVRFEVLVTESESVRKGETMTLADIEMQVGLVIGLIVTGWGIGCLHWHMGLWSTYMKRGLGTD